MLATAAAPVFEAMSDRLGRRPVLVGAVLAVLTAVVPAAALVTRGDTAGMLAAYCLVRVALGAVPVSVFLAEMFPTHLRYSGLSLTYGLGSALFGGTAPLAAPLLTRHNGQLRSAVWYMAAVAAVATIAAFVAPETAHRHLDAEA